jgi:hypothetical protein
MSLLRLIFPWFLFSCIVTPLIGALVSRSLGSQDEGDNAIQPQAGCDEDETSSEMTTARVLSVSRYRGQSQNLAKTRNRASYRSRRSGHCSRF